MKKQSRVACDCNGRQSTGIYEVAGDWLTLRSTLGDHRVRLGLANPQKLAARLMKNLCLKAPADTPQTCFSPSLSDKAHELVDIQRDRIVTMARDDPSLPKEERVLDQMVTNAQLIDTASQLLEPQNVPDAPLA